MVLPLLLKDFACLFCRRLRNIPVTEPQSVSCVSTQRNPEGWRVEENNNMKISNAARLIFWLAAIFAIGILVRAESSEKRANIANTKSAPLRIVDQNGRPAVSGVPSATNQIVDVAVGPDFAFHPDTVNISVGDTVRWTWDGSGHSVTSGPPCQADSQYCSPNDTMCSPGMLSNAGTVYMHTFGSAGSYSYHCLSHCIIGMTGVVNVTGSCAQSGWSAAAPLPTPGVRLAGVYFSAQREVLRHGRSRLRHSWQRVHSSV